MSKLSHDVVMHTTPDTLFAEFFGSKILEGVGPLYALHQKLA